jgi:hypothetical protein
VKELSKEVVKDDSYASNVDRAFDGKTVEWTGKVKQIRRPEKDEKSPGIEFSMKPETLVLNKSKTVTLEKLNVQPADDEWETWKSVTVGDTVVFRTTLNSSSAAFPVLMVMQGMGVNAGTTAAWINTKGGSCLKKQ